MSERFGKRVFNRIHLRESGYTLLRRENCRRCHMPVEIWLTHPNRKEVPYDLAPDADYAQCHYNTCTGKKPGSQPSATQPVNLHIEAKRIAERLGVRCVVLITDAEPAFAYRLGESGEDLRSDCITAGNLIREEIGGRHG